jgi:hypothetical protein
MPLCRGLPFCRRKQRKLRPQLETCLSIDIYLVNTITTANKNGALALSYGRTRARPPSSSKVKWISSFWLQMSAQYSFALSRRCALVRKIHFDNVQKVLVPFVDFWRVLIFQVRRAMTTAGRGTSWKNFGFILYQYIAEPRLR